MSVLTLKQHWSLVSEEQQKRVMGYIEKGIEEGAEVLCGGSNPFDQGYFVSPTVFADVNDEMTIAKEEIFGPVISAIPFNDIDEVIERANKSQFGLAAGVWTENVKTAHYVASKVRAGTVWVNCYNVFDADLHLEDLNNLVLAVKWDLMH